jgi:hypothetical protein
MVAIGLAVVVAPLGLVADETRVFRYPSKSFLEFDPAKPDAPATPRKGVQLLPPQTGEGIGTRYDVREFYAAAGLTFPEATYFRKAGVVVVRAPQQTWDDYDAAVTVDAVPDASADSIRMTITLVEFTAAEEGLELPRLGYPELRRKAGATWRELRTLTFSGPSGRPAGASNISASGKKPRAPAPPRAQVGEALPVMVDLGPDECGIRCLVEPQIAPDGRACDISYDLQWRAARGEPAFKLQSNIQLLEDRPAVLQLDTPPTGSVPGRPARRRALVVAFHVMKLGDWREGGKPEITKPVGKPKK